VVVDSKLTFDGLKEELKKRFAIPTNDFELQLFDEAVQASLTIESDQDWRDGLVGVGALVKLTIITTKQ